jgi:hypothetical protein
MQTWDLREKSCVCGELERCRKRGCEHEVRVKRTKNEE